MDRAELETLQGRVADAPEVDTALLCAVADAVRPLFPDAPDPREGPTEPTDAALHLVDGCLPGWTISLHGQATEPDGHWHCTLRRSEARDDDAVIGVGRGPRVSLALLEALLRIAVLRSPS